MKTAVSAFALTLLTNPALAGPESEMARDSGVSYTYDLSTGQGGASDSPASSMIYDNIGTLQGAFSSTDVLAVYGDRIRTLGTGEIQACRFSVYNSGSSNGSLTTAQFAINFYRGSDFSLIGGFNTNFITFTGGLAPGFFTTVTVTGLGGVGIDLDTTDVIMTQQIIGIPGGSATRTGFVHGGPLLPGTSSDPMVYIEANTVGTSGFYTLSSAGNPIAASIFYSVTVPCVADCDMNGTLNVDDIDCFVAAFLSSDLGVADCNGNGVLNVDDVDCFVAAFLAGCS